MTAKLRVAGLTVMGVAVLYTAAAWLIGVLVQGQLQRDEQRLADSSSYLVLEQHSYRRGAFTSSEQLSFALSAPLRQLLARSPGAKALPALRLSVTHRIAHGPLPRLSSWGLADVQTEVLLAPEGVLSAGTHPLLLLLGRLGWFGTLRARIQGPAFEQRSPDGTLVSWSGASGELAASRGLASWSLTLTAPALRAQGQAGHLQLSGLSLRTNRRRAFDTLYVGDTDLQLEELDGELGADMPLQLRGLRAHTTSSVQDQYLQQNGELTADSLRAAQFSATGIAYRAAMRHVHAPTLAALVRALREAQRLGAGADPAANRDTLLAADRQYALQLALHEPVFDLTRLGFEMPQGMMGFSAHFAVPGLAQEDPRALQGVPGLAALVRHLQVSADLRVDTTLLDALLGSRQPSYAAQLQQLLQQGYLRRDGNAYLCHLDYQGGRLRLNGQRFPPQS